MRVTKMSMHIGAEVSGVDLRHGLEPAEVLALEDALAEHKVLFFADQRLDDRSHVAFACHFGQPTPAHPLVGASDFPGILPVDNRRNEERYGVTVRERWRARETSNAGWHTDLSPLVNPPAVCILRADAVPDWCGDTHWANLTAAYAELSDDVKSMLRHLHAEHRYAERGLPNLKDDAYRSSIAAKPLSAVHPVVRWLPQRGEACLFVNPLFTSHIVELSGVESRHILNMLFEVITDPRYTVRYRWKSGSVAMWENLSTVHLPPVDLPDGADRVLYRVALRGDVPVDVTGRPSHALVGEPW